MSTPERDLIVGGQAVIEGVMMRTPSAYAIAVRKADGTIVNTAARLPKWSDKYPILKLPVLRGGAVLVQSMGLGIKALNYSANEAFAEAEEAQTEEVKVALSPAIIEGEGDFAGLTGAVPGLFPVPTQKRSKDELKKGTTAAAAGSIVFAPLRCCLQTRSSSPPVGPRLRRRLQARQSHPAALQQPNRLNKHGTQTHGPVCARTCIPCVHQWLSIWWTG
jgi:hypothetical protein